MAALFCLVLVLAGAPEDAGEGCRDGDMVCAEMQRRAKGQAILDESYRKASICERD